MTTTTALKNPSHGQDLVHNLSSLYSSAAFADVKLICGSGAAFWAHKTLLASVSPVFLADIFGKMECEAVAIVHLPNIRPSHLKRVLDYIYTGRMLVSGANLAAVLRVFETLRFNCGVSVSKMVQPKLNNVVDREEEWVKEADFDFEYLKSSANLKKEESAFDDEDELQQHQQHQQPVHQVEVHPVVVAGHREDDDEGGGGHVEVIEESDSDNEHDPREEQRNECLMCGKAFKHADNLQVHIQSHLGSGDRLNQCAKCRKIFPRKKTLELHEKSSHVYKLEPKTGGKHRFLTERRLVKKSLRLLTMKKGPKGVPRMLVLRREELKREKMAERRKAEALRLQREQERLKREKEEETLKLASMKLTMKVKMPSPEEMKPHLKETTCAFCLKDFSSVRSLERHAERFHPKPSPPPPPPPPRAAPRPSRRTSSTSSTSSSSSKRRRSSTSDAPQTPKKSKSEQQHDDLTCPTCDKTFPAKSIFERHLKTSKHGSYAEEVKTAAAGDDFYYYQPPKLKDLPHMNKVLQPTMEVGGREVNKYECHLCSKVFLRVKDLAKHREKTCSAWSSN